MNSPEIPGLERILEEYDNLIVFYAEFRRHVVRHLLANPSDADSVATVLHLLVEAPREMEELINLAIVAKVTGTRDVTKLRTQRDQWQEVSDAMTEAAASLLGLDQGPDFPAFVKGLEGMNLDPGRPE